MPRGLTDYSKRVRDRDGRDLLPGVALALAGLTAASCSPSEPAPRPNVLLISLDSTCKDLVGAYGRRPAHAPELSPSPRLDALAEEGVLFEDASSTTSWTLPAHVSMLTGVPALVHAVDIDLQTPNPELKNLAQVLSANGYSATGFFSGPYLDPRFGFSRGFERYEGRFGGELMAATAFVNGARAELDAVMSQGRAADVPAARRALEEAERLVEQLSHQNVSSSSVTDAALEVLDGREQDGRPFFLFLHYFDAHYDYTPPAPFSARFDPDYTGTLDGVDFITNPKVATPIDGDPFRVTRTASDRDLEHIFALYEGEMAWVDEQVGRVLDRLEELDLARNTLVILTADHGDEFFEHGSLGHRKTLYEEVLQVPMIMRYPGLFPAGLRVAEPVSILSIVPTVLDLLQIESPSPLFSPSLLDLAQGEPGPGEHGILGRLIFTQPAAQGFTTNGARQSVPVLQVFLTETYRKGPIKVFRRRRWTEFHRDAGTPERVLEHLEALQQSEKAVEIVTWINVAQHPREAERYFSKDFSDPAVRAVLQEFHDLYPKLIDQRREAGETEADEGTMAGLAALGYADGGPAPEQATAAFEVPAPGIDILGRE